MGSAPELIARLWRGARTPAGMAYVVVWVVAIAAFAFVHAPQERAARILSLQMQLQARAELRAGIVNRWATERFQDAQSIGRYASVNRLFTQARSTPSLPLTPADVADATADIRAMVTSQHELGGFAIDLRGAVVAGSPTVEPPALYREAARTATRDGRRRALFLSRPGGRLALAFVTPIAEERSGGEARGAVVIEVDPGASLFEMIALDRTAFASAEVVLAGERDGVMYNLTPLRKTGAAPMAYHRVAGSQTQTPAYAAVRGRRTFDAFVDYAGDRVYAATDPVPATGWGLVVKIDEAEALGPYYAQMWRDGATGGSLLLLGGAVALLWAQTARRRRAQLVERSHARIATLVDNANDPLLVIDRDGRIQNANRRADEFYGVEPGPPAGRLYTDLVEPSRRAAAQADLRRVLDQGQLVFESVQVSAGGVAVPVEVSGRLVPMLDGDQIVAVVRDIRERKAAEQRIFRLNTVLKTLSDINHLIVHESDPQHLLAEACRILVERGGFKSAWIGMPAADYSIRYVVGAGNDDGYVSTSTPRWDDTVLGQGVAGRAIRERRTFINADYGDPTMAPWRDAALARGIRSSAACPIVRDGDVVALLNVYADVPAAFDEDMTALLDGLAGDVGFALSAIADRDARRQAEEARRRVAERAEAIVTHSPEAKVAITVDGIVTLWNPAAERLLGWTAAEVLGRPHPGASAEEAQSFRGIITRTLAGQPLRNLETDARHKDGTNVAVVLSTAVLPDPAGGPDNVLVSFTDIRRVREVEAAIRRSEARYRLVTEHAGDVIWTVDAETGCFTFLSPSIEQMLGYTPEEMIGRRGTDFLSPESAGQLRRQQGIPGPVPGAPPTVSEMQQVRKDGTLIWAEVKASAVRDESGRLQLVGVTRDITARKAAEAQTAAKMEELRRWHDATVGRERRVMDLKRDINALLAQLGQPPRYTSVSED